MRFVLTTAGIWLLFSGCIDPVDSSTTFHGAWTLSQRMPGGGVGEITEGNSASAAQGHPESAAGTAQVLVGALDPHTRVAARTAHPLLQRQEVNLIHGTGIPGNP